jgi:hypothetical protein
MSVVRYRSKSITPVDVVQWNGQNLAEVQELCPEASIPDPGVAIGIVFIPGAGGETLNVMLNEYVMKEVGTGIYSKLEPDVFHGLYRV